MDKLGEIFQKQAAHLHSLKPTYAHNGFELHASGWPWNINDRKVQEEFRLLAWRYTEEIFEALQEWQMSQSKPTPFFKEELADALHFLVELCLVAGVEQEELLTGQTRQSGMAWKYSADDALGEFFDQAHKCLDNQSALWDQRWWFYEAIRAMAMLMMQLKQRPWRVDHRPIERKTLVMGLFLVFRRFTDLCLLCGVSAEAIYQEYCHKNKINAKRVEDFGV